MAIVRSEIDHVAEFDYIIINEELDHAVHDLVSIVRAERVRTKKQLQKRATQIASMQSNG
jgi:guanylate kinase